MNNVNMHGFLFSIHFEVIYGGSMVLRIRKYIHIVSL